jgi:aspartyl aminopeptidase
MEHVPAEQLCRFINASPSPFHVCQTVAELLDVAGFDRVDERDDWTADGTGRRYLIRDGSVVAWAVPPDAGPTTPFRIVGAHTDSPNLRVKPHPDRSVAGTGQVALEPYGGVLLTSWLGRDLGLSGRVAVSDPASETGGVTLRLVLVDRPILHLPQLAIHLDRTVNQDGLVVNPQQHLAALWDVGGPDLHGFSEFLAAELDVEPSDVLAWEVMAHDLTPAATMGRNGGLLSAPRLDNLCSSWAAVGALLDTIGADDPPDTTSVVCLFDSEEIGSVSASGAAGSLLPTVLERIGQALGAERQEHHRALAGSLCASADMAHATHPNYPDRHEPAHWVRLGGGPVVKTNVNGRYATDARTAGLFIDGCERAGLPHQVFANRADLACGSTIGPITSAALGIPTVDVGAPMLAMHAARELMAAEDVGAYAAALTAFLYL